jgi:hypothetical protein
MPEDCARGLCKDLTNVRTPKPRNAFCNAALAFSPPGETTALAVAAAVELEPREPLTVKGKSRGASRAAQVVQR